MDRHYTYRVEWSPEDGEYVGLVAEFPSLSWLRNHPSRDGRHREAGRRGHRGHDGVR